MSKTAANFVGNIPENYDKHLGPRIFTDYAKDLAIRSQSLPAQQVLELAAGTGIVSVALRNVLPNDCHLTVTDLNQPMLEVAKDKFEKNAAVSFEAIDATDIPLDDNQIDLVVCQFGVMFFPDKEKSYREVSRILKNKGTYLFNVWGTWEQNRFAEIAHNAVAKFFPDNPPGFYKVPFGYNDQATIEKALLSNGFSAVHSTQVQLTSAIPSAQHFATGLVFGNPLFEEITARQGDPEAIKQAIAADLEHHLGAEMSLQAMVIQAEK